MDQQQSVWTDTSGRPTQRKMRVGRLVNVSVVSGSMAARDNWTIGSAAGKGEPRQGPTEVYIPLSTVEQPVVFEAPGDRADILLRLYGGSANRGACGLIEWESRGNVPETDKDRETMKLIELQAKVLKGEADPPMMKAEDLMPFRAGMTARAGRDDAETMPATGWGWEKLQGWAKINRVALPSTKDIGVAITHARTIAEDRRANGSPLRAAPAPRAAA